MTMMDSDAVLVEKSLHGPFSAWRQIKTGRVAQSQCVCAWP